MSNARQLFGVKRDGKISQSIALLASRRWPGDECVPVEIVEAGERERQEERVKAWQREGAHAAEEAHRLRAALEEAQGWIHGCGCGRVCLDVCDRMRAALSGSIEGKDGEKGEGAKP